MESNSTQQNKMGVMPINKLLVSMSLPMIISMLVQAMYNIVDSIFVARINENALTAVSLVFPIQNLMIAVAAGTCVGMNSLLSRSLGEKNHKQANDAAKNGIFVCLLSAAAFALMGLFFSRIFFALQTDDPQIIRYGQQYMFIVNVFSIGVFMQFAFERLMQSTGNTFYNMITQGMGAIINIILDPILIFGLFGFPRLEIAGAAIATVIGQISAMLLSLYFNIKKNPELNINMKGFRPSRTVIANIYRVGVPSIIMQAIGSVMLFGFNKILMGFSTTATAVLGIYFRLQSFIFMPVFGLTNGVIPIVAYNYGARNKQRIMDTVKLAATATVLFMILGSIAFKMFPNQLLSIFNASDELKTIGAAALRTISWGFPIAGFCIIITTLFQALGNGVYSLFTSLIRQLIILLPAAYVLANYVGLHAVWWSFPLAEAVCLVATLIFYRNIHRVKIKPLELSVNMAPNYQQTEPES